MTNPLQFSRLNSAQHPDFESFFAIYTSSLPVSEQKSRAELVSMLSRGEYLFLMLSCNTELRGFAIAYVSPNYPFYLLEYMAVGSAYRNLGYGAELYRALSEAVTEQVGSTRCAVIEVDSPAQASSDQAMRQRRVNFYRRCGAEVVDGLDYLLPLDAAGVPPAMWLMLAAVGDSPSSATLCQWLVDIFQHVYQKPVTDHRLQIMCQQLTERRPC